MNSEIIRNALVITLNGESPMSYSQIRSDATSTQLLDLGLAFGSLLRAPVTDLRREVRTHLFRP